MMYQSSFSYMYRYMCININIYIYLSGHPNLLIHGKLIPDAKNRVGALRSTRRDGGHADPSGS